jgi:hypothetical protein
MGGDRGAPRLRRGAPNVGGYGGPFRGPPCQWARALGPLALAALVMLPRLASAQFGLLDDGLTLQTGREVHGRWSSVLYLIPETGRFFPAYWLVYSGIWSLVGTRPLAFFTVNVLVLASLLAMLARLVRFQGGTRASVVVATTVFALGGPAIETFYTLSKAESLQLAWIALSLLATAASAAHARWSVSRAAWIALAAAALLLAHATKETSVVLIPIALGWLAVEWRSSSASPGGVRFAATYVVIAIVAAVVFAGLRWQYAALKLAEGTYTSAYIFQSATVGPALFRIAAWLVRDFAFLLPLVAVSLLRPRLRRPILYAGVWMTGWLLVYLPWPATFEYYLLPFALGAAVLAGIVAGDLWSERASARRRLAWSALLTTALLWSVATVNAAADARIQLTVDRANADLVDFLGTLPRGSRVVLNMTPVNEYHFELPMHLTEIKHRPDIVFMARPPRPESREGPPADAFVLTPEMTHQPGPTVRIALHEARVRHDTAALDTLMAADAAPVYRAAQQIGIVELGIQRLLCRVAVSPVLDPTYCPTDRGVIYRRTFSYGWQVHRLPFAATMRHGA